MSGHLSSEVLNVLADGELAGEQLARANEHLAGCSQCTSNALVQSLLKSAAGRAGQRYAPPADLRERMVRIASEEAARAQASPSAEALRSTRGFGWYGWAGAVALLLMCVGVFTVQRRERLEWIASSESAGLVTEVSDQHIATLAANSPPEVISSDRHTVKPWFQGKIPFSFNLPQDLPGDVTLDGANLTYLRGRPTAQLLYSVGKHRVSVFLQQGAGAGVPSKGVTGRAGFYVTGFSTGNLEVVAVSDVDAARLSDLVGRIEQAQVGSSQQLK
jgi:anti-sigma factor RsiW